MKKQIPTWVIIVSLLLLCAIGIGLMAYPYISSKLTAASQAEVLSEYQDKVELTDTTQRNAIRDAAREYNRALFAGEINPMETKENGYNQQLKVPGSRVMAYIEIPKINVRLPIYHGVGDSALHAGAGHMEQTSLPIGGESTRAVISAHSGMAESPMFTDLGKLVPGDRFTIDVLGETLLYEVYEVETVLPAAIGHIRIQPGEDLVTLITCTPIGVNTHRLLVHGKRVEIPTDNQEGEETTNIPVDSKESNSTSLWSQKYQQSVIAAVIVVIALPAVCVPTYFGVRAVLKRRASHEK